MKRVLADIRSIFKQAFYTNALCYHSISNSASKLERIHSVEFSKFKRQIEISKIANLITSLASVGRKNAGSRMEITFDDAYVDLMDDAIPYLIKNKIEATIFINSSTLNGNTLWRDNLRLVFNSGLMNEFVHELPASQGFTLQNIYVKSKQPDINSCEFTNFLLNFVKRMGIGFKDRLYMNVGELKEISATGIISLGNHTRNHFMLSSLTKEQQQEEILGGHKDLENVGLEINDVFAAPFGGYASINTDTLTILSDKKYKELYLTNNGKKVNQNKELARSNLKIRNRYLPKN